ncbi:zinc finger protein 283-like [Galleria mellonella]|uniref:Zinc finger protein 283-like n=1 Tax=Galleria mellonella TaxID=7137 RepID=A0A6J1W9P2_GALME|nr:zinc finger protein 283-like [Galleria mellonella]
MASKKPQTNLATSSIKSPCNVCGKEYNVGAILNRHVRTHKPIKCPECSLEFKDYEIPQHLKEVHNNMSMTCGICGYQVDKRCLMIKHQRRVHLKEKNYTCHICNVNVFGGYDLKKHLVKHNPVKMYECAHCQKRYPRRTTLVQHLKIHAGDKKKVCTICDQRFVQKASLNYHMTKHHPESC